MDNNYIDCGWLESVKIFPLGDDNLGSYHMIGKWWEDHGCVLWKWVEITSICGKLMGIEIEAESCKIKTTLCGTILGTSSFNLENWKMLRNGVLVKCLKSSKQEPEMARVAIAIVFSPRFCLENKCVCVCLSVCMHACMLCNATQRDAMQCNVMYCYVLLCYVVLC